MPDTRITPRAFAIILLASAGREVASFMIQILEQFLIEAQSRVVNFAIQCGTMAIRQSVVGAKFVDPTAPAKLFLQVVESLTTASSPEEATSKGIIAAAVLIISSLSSKDPNASSAFAGLLVVLVQNVLLPGSQAVIFSTGLLKIYIINNILI